MNDKKDEANEQAEVHCSYDELVKVASIKPNPRNPNKHPPEQIKLLCKIISTQGWRAPITISNQSGFIVRGHGRFMAAQQLKQDTVPIDFQDYATPEDEMADLMADNRLAELSELDVASASEILEELGMNAYDMDLTGWIDGEMEKVLELQGEDETETFLPEGFELPEGKIKSKDFLSKISIFVSKESRKTVMGELKRLKDELGEDNMRIMS